MNFDPFILVMNCALIRLDKSNFWLTIFVYMFRVTSFSADGVLAGRAIVAVVALALEGLADASAVRAVVPLLAD